MSNTTFTVDRENLQVIITRTFNVSPELVFKALTTPELISQWWGPRDLTTEVDKLELKVGGVWRFLNKQSDGVVHAFNGVYKEIDEPNKLVYTFEYEPMAGHILTETILLEERDGKTYMTDTTHYPEIGDLEGMVGMNMEQGSRDSMERLGELLQK